MIHLLPHKDLDYEVKCTLFSLMKGQNPGILQDSISLMLTSKYIKKLVLGHTHC